METGGASVAGAWEDKVRRILRDAVHKEINKRNKGGIRVWCVRSSLFKPCYTH